MSPARISFTVNGKESRSVTFTEGTTGVLETPVGRALGGLSDSFLGGRRVDTVLPGDTETVYLFAKNQPRSPLGLAGILEKLGWSDRDSRDVTYQTSDGEVVIYVNVW